MFYYYGGKMRLAKLYPPPAHRVIVEPFAGSAAYSMLHLRTGGADRAVLVEKDPRIADLWRRLLSMTEAEVRDLPRPVAGTSTSDPFVMLVMASNAVASCSSLTVTPRMPGAYDRQIANVCRTLRHVRGRVEILEGDYTLAPDLAATWFVDPPYCVKGDRPGSAQGDGYAAGCRARDLDFAALASWVQARSGQVIVCEQDGATWLPFHLLRSAKDTLGVRRPEVMWTNDGGGRLFA